MSDYNEMVQFLKARKPTVILKYSTGAYGLAGSIPVELTKESSSIYSPDRVSLVWSSEEEVISALLSLGITRFQKSDFTWYEA